MMLDLSYAIFLFKDLISLSICFVIDRRGLTEIVHPRKHLKLQNGSFEYKNMNYDADGYMPPRRDIFSPNSPASEQLPSDPFEYISLNLYLS